VFESVGKRVLINVELTNYASPKDQLVSIVAEIVKRHKMESDILFSSFRPVNLVHMRELLPDTPAAILCQGGYWVCYLDHR
jgi:glycerophosphoryl diester phosphodiesterase